MRTENLTRLSKFDINIKHPEYLVYKYFHADLFSSLNKYVKGNLLDIGCGNKPYLPIVAPLVDTYIGCDIVQSNKNCVDILCEATNIPLEDKSFDTIICTQTIEHVEDHQGLVNEAFRLLKSDGFFIISGPLYWPLHEEPYDFFRFTKYGFKYILEKAGFSIEEVKSNGGKWALCGQVLIHTVYPDIQKNKNKKLFLINKLLKLLGGIKAINKFFSQMDDIHKDEKNTMNYVVVARKMLVHLV